MSTSLGMDVMNQPAGAGGADPRWKDLYKVGGLAAIAGVVITVLAVVAFFIWPYETQVRPSHAAEQHL